MSFNSRVPGSLPLSHCKDVRHYASPATRQHVCFPSRWGGFGLDRLFFFSFSFGAMLIGVFIAGG
jgi:hypothetical protein